MSDQDDKDKQSENKSNLKNDNVVPFNRPDAKKNPPNNKEQEPRIETKVTMPHDEQNHAPVINLPPVTKYFLGFLVVIHLIITLVLSPDKVAQIYTTFGFIPAYWSGEIPFKPIVLLSPLTHMVLHGSWLHIAMNGFMLMAFGSGVEKNAGAKNTIFIFIFSGLCGIALQYALNPSSIYAVIGASGGLSGLFAAAFVIINRMRSRQNGKSALTNAVPFIILWVVISIAFGLMGSPDGHAVAWAAHLGGFFGGFAALKILKLI